MKRYDDEYGDPYGYRDDPNWLTDDDLLGLVGIGLALWAVIAGVVAVMWWWLA